MKNSLLARQEVSPQHPGLPLIVVFTTVQSTLLSLRVVDHRARGLSTRLNLLISESFEYSAPMITPMRLADFTARYFLTMLPHASDWQIQLARYPAATEDLWEVLSPQSLLILAGTTHRFWPSPEQRFARQLRQAGHEVIFFSTPSPDTGSSVHSDTAVEACKKGLSSIA